MDLVQFGTSRVGLRLSYEAASTHEAAERGDLGYGARPCVKYVGEDCDLKERGSYHVLTAPIVARGDVGCAGARLHALRRSTLLHWFPLPRRRDRLQLFWDDWRRLAAASRP